MGGYARADVRANCDPYGWVNNLESSINWRRTTTSNWVEPTWQYSGYGGNHVTMTYSLWGCNAMGLVYYRTEAGAMENDGSMSPVAYSASVRFQCRSN